MRVAVEFETAELEVMNALARDAFIDEAQTYAKELYREAQRLDFGGRSLRRRPELTSSHIRDAAEYQRRGYSRPGRSWKAMAAHVAVPSLGVIAGVFGTDLAANSVPFAVATLGLILVSAYLVMRD